MPADPSSRATGDAHDNGLAMPANVRPLTGAIDSIVPRTSRCVDVERFRADLREGGVEEMLGILLDTFVEDCPGRLGALEQAVQAGDLKAIESAAHAFKSGAGTVRANALAGHLRELEAAARSRDVTIVAGLLEQIRTEYQAVLSELASIPQQ